MTSLEEFVEQSPSDMRPAERMFLYSLVRGLRPDRVLEIGAFKGGSAMIVARALHENGTGRAVGIDPFPQADFAQLPLHGRYELIVGFSPDSVVQAITKLGGQLSLVLIDGMHTYSAVKADLFGVLPYLAPNSTVLLHDAFHYGVRKAIDACVQSVPGMIDCGLMCNTPSCETDPLVDPWITYCGLYMLRYRQRVVSVEEHLSSIYRQYPGMDPSFGDDLLDHNEWACVDTPCARCVSLAKRLLSDPEPRFVRASRTEGVWRLEKGKKRLLAAREVPEASAIRFVPVSAFRLVPDA